MSNYPDMKGGGFTSPPPTPQFQRVSLRPVQCLGDAYSMLGDQYWLFLGMTLVAVIIANAAPMAIMMGPMFCGLYLALLHRMAGQRVEFSLLFKGLDYFLDGLIATLIMVAVSLLVTLIPGGLIFLGVMGSIAAAANEAGLLAGGLILLTIVVGLLSIGLAIVASACLIFSFPLIVDQRLKATQAVGLSYQAVRANLGGVVGLLLLNMLISMVASLCCYIPALLFMPISFGSFAIAYRQIFPRGLYSRQ